MSRDLLDVELSYLIREVCQNKQIHFLVIADCCHSGEMTRDLQGANGLYSYRGRTIKRSDHSIPWQHYLGAETYKIEYPGVKIPAVKHMLIAACGKRQKAVEGIFDKQCRGVFSYYLVKALSELGRGDYSLLLNKIRFGLWGSVRQTLSLFCEYL